MPLTLFPAIVVTIVATEQMILSFGGAPDYLRWGLLYAVCVVLPWVFFIYEQRRGTEQRVAAAPLGVGPLALYIASGFAQDPATRFDAPGSSWGMLIAGMSLIVLLVLQKFRVVR